MEESQGHKAADSSPLAGMLAGPGFHTMTLAEHVLGEWHVPRRTPAVRPTTGHGQLGSALLL